MIKVGNLMVESTRKLRVTFSTYHRVTDTRIVIDAVASKEFIEQ